MSRGNSLTAKDITDGEAQTIMLVEIANSGIHWAEPRNLPLEQALLGINPPHVKFAISSRHGDFEGAPSYRKGAHVAFADSSIGLLQESTPIEVLRALLTPSGGEALSGNKHEQFEILPSAAP